MVAGKAHGDARDGRLSVRWLTREPTRRGALPLLVPLLAFGLMLHPVVYMVPVVLACWTVLVITAPRFAAVAAAYGFVLLGMYGLLLARDSASGYGYWIPPSMASGGMQGIWNAQYLLPISVGSLVFGLWLIVRNAAPGARTIAELGRQLRGRGRRPASLLLLPPLVLFVEMSGTYLWFHMYGGWASTRVLIVIGAAVLLIVRKPLAAAVVGLTGLFAFGGYGILIALYSPVPGWEYGAVAVTAGGMQWLAAVQGLAVLALAVRLTPSVIGFGPDPELAKRVDTLTKTRTDATDTALAELRRIERDLHDGAQARLVALGMSLRAAERMIATQPEAAHELVVEARESSSRALTDLRDLVRGIYPPVLADRGLGDAIRALALDSPLRTETDVELPGEVDMPVAAAVYFAVAEMLTNAVRHADADRVQIRVRYADGALRAQVSDDGRGGADPSAGTGLAGVERRLATFDGILAVSSPLGGPTIIAIEVPCALSSVKTSTC